MTLETLKHNSFLLRLPSSLPSLGLFSFPYCTAPYSVPRHPLQSSPFMAAAYSLPGIQWPPFQDALPDLPV